jgi:hypothetical protein
MAAPTADFLDTMILLSRDGPTKGGPPSGPWGPDGYGAGLGSGMDGIWPGKTTAFCVPL